MKKLVSFLLVGCVALGLTACGVGPAPEDGELISRATLLLEASKPYNRLLYEEGIPYTGEEISNGYYLADKEALGQMGIHTLGDLFTQMSGIWTQSYVDNLRETQLFKAIYGTNSLMSQAWCVDGKDGILVMGDEMPLKTDPVEYHYDTLKVEDKEAKRARLSLTVTVTGENGETADLTLYVSMAKQGDTWLLTSPTVARFPTQGDRQ